MGKFIKELLIAVSSHVIADLVIFWLLRGY